MACGVTAVVGLGDSPEEAVGLEDVSVAGRRGVWVGLAGVCLELGEGPVELRSPMVVEVPVVGQTCVGREPVVDGCGVVAGMQGTHTPSSWSKYSSWEQL